jgi:hypothetical protein
MFAYELLQTVSSLDELVLWRGLVQVDAVDAHGLGKGVQLLAPELRCGHASSAIEHVVPSSRV